jgi:hypothetical protein
LPYYLTSGNSGAFTISSPRQIAQAMLGSFGIPQGPPAGTRVGGCYGCGAKLRTSSSKVACI